MTTRTHKGLTGTLPVSVAVLMISATFLSPRFNVGGRGAGSIDLRAEDIVTVFLFLTIVLGALLRTKIIIIDRRIAIAALSYFITLSLSSIWAVASGELDMVLSSLHTLKMFQYALVGWMVYYVVCTNKFSGERLWNAMCWGAIVLGGINVLQAVSGAWRAYGVENGPFPNGGTFLAILPMLLFSLLNRGIRPLTTAAFVLSWIGVAVSGSRASFFGALAGVVLIGFLSIMRRQRKRHFVRLLVIVLVSAVLFGVVLSDSVAYQRILESLRIVTDGVASVSSLRARIEIQRPAWNAAIGERPLIGWGAGSFRVADSLYYRLLLESGVLGMLTFFGLIASLVISIRKRSRVAGHLSCAITLAYLVAGYAAESLFVAKPAMLFWICQGWLLGMARTGLFDTACDIRSSVDRPESSLLMSAHGRYGKDGNPGEATAS